MGQARIKSGPSLNAKKANLALLPTQKDAREKSGVREQENG